MKRFTALGLLLLLAACAAKVAPDVLHQWQSRTLYTCCNIHYEGDEVVDANYYVGTTLPFGSPAAVQDMTKDSLSFTSGPTKLKLSHRYGSQQESAEQYFGRILVGDDPHVRFQTYWPQVQKAITDGHVERGMTREQVIMSLGYPPTHRTASTDLNLWTYWYNRWVTYTVSFDEQGKVSQIDGSNAPTSNQPIVAPTPAPKPAASKAQKGKKR